MNKEPSKKPSLLAPIEDLYDPEEVASDRVLAKIRGSIATSRRKPSLGSATGKILGLACLTVLFVGGYTMWSSVPGSPGVVPVSRPDTPADPVVVPSAVGQAAPPVAVTALPEAVTSAPLAHKDAPPVRSPAGTEARPAPPVAAPSDDTLEREASLLGQAERALRGGDGERALALLDEHARLFPSGWLKNDRAAERILALCSLGRREQATREATTFLEGRTPSPLTRRVLQSCAGENPR